MELAANRLSFIHQSQKLNLAKDITIAYYELAFIAESIALNKKLSELMELILSSANTQYASGRGLQKNIFQTQIEISTLADEAIQLNKKYRVIENTIHALLNRTEYKAIRPPENIDLPMDEFPVEIFQKKALTNNPKVKALYLEIEQNSIMAKFAEKNIYPDVDLRLAYSQRDDDPSGNTRDDFVSLSATLNLPVWKHSRQDREIMSKKAEERSAANKYHDLLATLPLKIDALITEIKSAQKSYHLTQTLLIPQAINWSKASVSDYEVGKTGFSTMINARVQPLRFKLKARRYLFDIYQNKARLDALTGGISKE
jgi:outer membrane protein TolC